MDEPDVDRPDPGWRVPISIYGTVLAVLLVVSWQTISQSVENPRGVPGIPFRGDWFWGGWLRFDGGWYHIIASEGYTYYPGHQSTVAFFPGYPLLVRFVGRAIDNIAIGGIVITIVSGAGYLSLYWRWCARRLGREQALVAALALALYPYGWYLYGAVYGDAFFVLLVIGAFTLFERDQPVWAGIVGIAATATRPVGVALVVALVVGVLERRGAFEGIRRFGLPRRLRRPRGLRWSDAGVLLAPLGLVAWCVWLARTFDDPFLFSTAQEAWGQPSSPNTWFKRQLYHNIRFGTDDLYTYGTLLQGLLALGVLLLVPTIARRFGLRYAAYTAVLVMVPAIGSQDFQGMGRYLIGAFPAFAVIGSWLAGRPARARVALPIAGGLLMLGTTWFAHGLYLS